MTIGWLDLLVLVLATDALLVAWFKGSIFASYRARAEAWQVSKGILRPFFGELLSCPKCLPFHVAFWLYLAALLIPYGVGWHLVTVLAVAGTASRVYNGLTFMHQP